MPPMHQGQTPSGLPFMKMHGLGNDFVVIDERDGIVRATQPVVMAMADRHRGIGFDQLAVISNSPDGDAHLTFWNSDGSYSATCGNATRCIARYLMQEKGVTEVTVTTERGAHLARDLDGTITVNMGHPSLEWQDIPLAREMDTLKLPLPGQPVATGMGNPHCTFFVDDAEAIELETEGPRFEHDPLFPQRTNVQFASIIGENHIRMRVWERGAGVTLASGSSSCATAVAARRRGLVNGQVTMDLDGGQIMIDWRDDGIWMSGPTAHVFDGVWRP